jgi:hypothetical protein
MKFQGICLSHMTELWYDNGIVVWYDYGMVWYDYGMVWYDYGMVWYNYGMV